MPADASLLPAILEQCFNRESFFHGPDHWRRVAWIALRLLEEIPAADPEVALLFAVFHDSMRLNDGDDPEHGRRASRFLRELHGTVFTLRPEQLATLVHACDLHADGLLAEEPTAAVCWDADRLDLWRVHGAPEPRYFSTSVARREETRKWSRALQGETPDWGAVWEGYEALILRRAERQP